MQNAKVIRDVRNLVDSLASTGFVEALDSIRDQVFDLLSYIDETIEKVGGGVTEKPADKSKIDIKSKELSYYSPSWSFIKKFVFVLKSENRFIHFREAAKIIKDLDGSGHIDDLTHRLSNATRKLKKSGKLVKVQHGNSLKNTFWGLPKWLNDDGSIKEGYQYSTDVLKRDKGESKTNTSSLFDL